MKLLGLTLYEHSVQLLENYQGLCFALLTIVCALFCQHLFMPFSLLSCLRRNIQRVIFRLCGIEIASFRASPSCSSPDCVRCRSPLSVLNKAVEALDRMTKAESVSECSNEEINPTEENECAKDYVKRVRQILQSVVEQRELIMKSSNDSITSSPTVFIESRLLASPRSWWDDEFGATSAQLIGSFTAIKEEFLRVFLDERDLWKNFETSDGRWEIFPIVDQGVEVARSVCPVATNVVSSLPNFMSDCVFGNASFSVLHGNTKIRRHCGPTNLRIRAHLGLVVPAARCASLSVAGSSRPWSERACLFFDDSLPHSALLSAPPDRPRRLRAVLLLDLWHPSLAADDRRIYAQAFSPR